MKFLTPSEKIKETRKYLKMKQEDLQDEHVSRGLISMIETDQRVLAKNVAIKLVQKFRQKAKDLDIKFDINENFLLRSPKEDAELYCLKKLEDPNINENAEEILEIANKFNLLAVKAISYSKIADYFFVKKEYDKAFVNYNDSIAIYKDIKQNEVIPHLYFQIGLCKIRSFQYNDALSYFDICEHYSIMYKDIKTHQLVLYDIALCYKKLNKLDLALENIEKYLLFSNKEDDFYYYANILKANCYEAIGKHDIVIEIYTSLLAEISKVEGPLLGYIYNNLGIVYLDKADYKTSLEYFEMAEKIRNTVDKYNLCHTLVEKSEVFFRQQLYVDAINIIKSGIASAEFHKNYECLLKGNYSLLRIYEKINSISNLKNTCLTIAKFLKDNNNFNELTSIYVKLSLLFLNENDVEEAKKCLILSQNLI